MMLYPEGPHFSNNYLFWTDYLSNKIHKLNIVTFESSFIELAPEYSGATSILISDNIMFICCYDSHKLLELNMTTNQIVYEYDIPYPNDMCFDDLGGIYITSSARRTQKDPFNVESKATGNIYYKNKNRIITNMHIHPSIYYANGIVYSKKYNMVYVSEHLHNRILSFKVSSGVALYHRKVLYELPEYLNIPLLGPDGLALDDPEEFLYIAHFGSGNLIKYSFKSMAICVYECPFENVTNVALSKEKKAIAVTVANDGESPGCVMLCVNGVVRTI